uniref:Uncharacterized protein n=1 Tax=White spot syndrome virus TaxID=342409 RepID=A0A8E7F1T9_9VIRU|nr:MAG: hypothetical protein EDAONDGI_00131 [White spot syndrome virus]
MEMDRVTHIKTEHIKREDEPRYEERERYIHPRRMQVPKDYYCEQYEHYDAPAAAHHHRHRQHRHQHQRHFNQPRSNNSSDVTAYVNENSPTRPCRDRNSRFSERPNNGGYNRINSRYTTFDPYRYGARRGRGGVY